MDEISIERYLVALRELQADSSHQAGFCRDNRDYLGESGQRGRAAAYSLDIELLEDIRHGRI